MSGWWSSTGIRMLLSMVASLVGGARGGELSRSVQIAEGVALLQEVVERHVGVLEPELIDRAREVAERGPVQAGAEVGRVIKAVLRSPKARDLPTALLMRLSGWSARWTGSGR